MRILTVMFVTAVCFLFLLRLEIIAELTSGAPYSYGKEKETHQ